MPTQCIKQLQVHHDPHQTSIRVSGFTNVRHEPSQFNSTLNGCDSCDLKVFAKAKPLIQLHSQLIDNKTIILDY